MLPVSDDGGSTAEIVRVLGGPAVGDIRSRCLRLADNSDSEVHDRQDPNTVSPDSVYLQVLRRADVGMHEEECCSAAVQPSCNKIHEASALGLATSRVAGFLCAEPESCI